uniref:EGL-9 (inferred by orthology to a C. elegans protein) n=1 Tax=Anisakis simplex TaxID=6269 RepID=A0A0M3KEE4_ANISI
LMASKRDLTTLDIRSDLIYWFGNNSERDHGAVTIRLLISMIDSIIVHLNKFIPYNICGRSRAMIAVYPGNGTRYVKHVDNPLKDGRCITATYYVNENWNYYQADRLALFWSDRRNPHEVLPSFRNRFAITTWYFDENEKQKALKKKFDNNQQ